MSPKDLKYARTHEWVRLSQEGPDRIATVGISAFAVEALTDLVFIELPQPGRRVQASQPFGEIESVKAVSDLYSPVDGEVIAVHSDLANRLETLSTDPYGEGWMVKIRVENDGGLAELMSYSDYEKQCAEEQH